ncbi:MAG TPA: hypothetical protein VHC90_22140 [Bryobacteraceae bacterium]|nr:hypothetical protein [Bryobacteraceae bacterium]
MTENITPPTSEPAQPAGSERIHSEQTDPRIEYGSYAKTIQMDGPPSTLDVASEKLRADFQAAAVGDWDRAYRESAAGLEETVRHYEAQRATREAGPHYRPADPRLRSADAFVHAANEAAYRSAKNKLEYQKRLELSRVDVTKRPNHGPDQGPDHGPEEDLEPVF